MEQQAKDNKTALKTSPSKDLKQHHFATDTPGLNEKNQRVAVTSDSAKSLDVNIIAREITFGDSATIRLV